MTAFGELQPGPANSRGHVQRIAELDSSIAQWLGGQTRREWGDVAIVQQTKWADAEWAMWLTIQEIPVASLCLLARTVIFDATEVKVAGIKDVISEPQHRGQGHARHLMRLAGRFLADELEVEEGMLLCAEDVAPFYRAVGWHQTDAQVLFQQPQGTREWTQNAFLAHGRRSLRVIDLNGLPW